MRLSLLVLLGLSFASSTAQAAPREFDVVVYGGTSGGVAAAVQVSRMGKSVVLIEPGKHLGGLTSGGLGATDIGNKAAIGGISREFYQRIRMHYQDDANWKYEKRTEFKGHGHDAKEDTAWTFEPHVAEKIYNELIKEHKIVVVYSQRLDLKNGVKKDGPRIVSITTPAKCTSTRPMKAI
jgi:glycine/D-amino acid oxidase-like deaminating enzyme